jgi:hypothetical protein
MASLVDVALGSHAVGGLGGAGARDNSKGSGGHNTARGGPTSHRDIVGLRVSYYLPPYG